jgi:hypothetical protein
MQLSTINLSLTRAYGGGVPAWTPSALFSSGEEGAWYDPSDLSTMFQDSAGTTPVTADGQPVGLILDKSKGLVLGTELVTNGDFSNGTTGWSPYNGNTAISNVANTLRLTIVSGTATASSTSPMTTVIGKTYRGTCKKIATTGSGFKFYVGGAFGGGSDYVSVNNTATGDFEFIFQASSTTTYFSLEVSGSAGNYGDFDNISIKELAGNHASQATAAKRPLYKTAGGLHWLQFDGVDDGLATGNIDFTAIKKLAIFHGSAVGTVTAGIWKLLLVIGGAAVIEGVATIQIPVNGTNGSAIARPIGAPALKSDTWPNAGLNVPNVLSHLFDNNAATRQIYTRKNAAEVAFVSGTPYDSGFNNAPIYLSGLNSEAYNGRIYSMIVLGRLAATQEITDTETWVNSKTGAY